MPKTFTPTQHETLIPISLYHGSAIMPLRICSAMKELWCSILYVPLSKPEFKHKCKTCFNNFIHNILANWAEDSFPRSYTMFVSYCRFYLLHLIYILCLLHHVAFYFTSFNIVCLYDCVYEDPTEKRSPVNILTCAVFSWAILNKYIYYYVCYIAASFGKNNVTTTSSP